MLKYYIKIFTQHIYWFDSFIFKILKHGTSLLDSNKCE